MHWWTARTWGNGLYEKQQWHLWFAWHPVVVYTHKPEGVQQKVWLQTIWRCGEYKRGREAAYWSYVYSLTPP